MIQATAPAPVEATAPATVEANPYVGLTAILSTLGYASNAYGAPLTEDEVTATYGATEAGNPRNLPNESLRNALNARGYRTFADARADGVYL
jgi:hypothetical protein